ncbi:hypothetical protein D3C73_1470340 [compost metagenome]
MIAVNRQHRVIPHAGFLQLLDQLPDRIIRVIDGGNVIAEIRPFQVVGQLDFHLIFRYHERRMARCRYKLGIERFALGLQLR